MLICCREASRWHGSDGAALRSCWRRDLGAHDSSVLSVVSAPLSHTVLLTNWQPTW
jgi:hypothetical protein